MNQLILHCLRKKHSQNKALHFNWFVYVCFPTSWCHQNLSCHCPIQKKKNFLRPGNQWIRHKGVIMGRIAGISVISLYNGEVSSEMPHGLQEKFVEMLCFSGRALEKAAFDNISFTFSLHRWAWKLPWKYLDSAYWKAFDGNSSPMSGWLWNSTITFDQKEIQKGAQ